MEACGAGSSYVGNLFPKYSDNEEIWLIIIADDAPNPEPGGTSHHVIISKPLFLGFIIFSIDFKRSGPFPYSKSNAFPLVVNTSLISKSFACSFILFVLFGIKEEYANLSIVQQRTAPPYVSE